MTPRDRELHRVSRSRGRLDDALDPLVLAFDVGSTASRGDVYDAAGVPVEGGRRKVPHAFRTSGDGASEIDPDQVVDELGQIITGLAIPPPQGELRRGTGHVRFVVGLCERRRPCCHSLLHLRRLPLWRAGDRAAPRARRGGSAAAHRLQLYGSYLPGPVAVAAEERPRPIRRGPALDVVGRVRLSADARDNGGRHCHRRVDRPARPPYRTLGRWDQRMLAAARIEAEQLSQVRDPDVLGTPVEPVTLKRATLHGTTLQALGVLAPHTARAPVPTGSTLHPASDHRDYYRDRAEQYDRLYRARHRPAQRQLTTEPNPRPSSGKRRAPHQPSDAATAPRRARRAGQSPSGGRRRPEPGRPATLACCPSGT
jgi:hypothetical protein